MHGCHLIKKSYIHEIEYQNFGIGLNKFSNLDPKNATTDIIIKEILHSFNSTTLYKESTKKAKKCDMK